MVLAILCPRVNFPDAPARPASAQADAGQCSKKISEKKVVVSTTKTVFVEAYINVERKKRLG